MTTCADIRADCDGELCGCALAGRRGTGGSGQHRSARAECEDTPSGIPDVGTCCMWKDSNAEGGTVNGCTCHEYWVVGEETCANDTPHYGCDMIRPCDGIGGDTPGLSWCLIDKERSDPECTPEGENWDYCMPNINGRASSALATLALQACSSFLSLTECESQDCLWDSQESECYDQGNCVERPGTWNYGLEQDDTLVEANGAARASTGGWATLVATLLCLLAVGDVRRA
jgi:hypothetical protein